MKQHCLSDSLGKASSRGPSVRGLKKEGYGVVNKAVWRRKGSRGLLMLKLSCASVPNLRDLTPDVGVCMYAEPVLTLL
jgi:hypothetical protein